MKRVAIVFAVVLLTGCSQQSDTEGASPAVVPEATQSTARASGTVEAIDVAAGKISIAHGPVESLDWPAMTMAFKATPEQIASVQVGESVRFEFASTGMDGTILSIETNE